MNWVSILFFVIASLICCNMFKKGVDVVSPARIFGLTWSIVFGLVNLKLSGLQPVWTTIHWIVALIGPLSFLFGLFIVSILNIGSQQYSINQIREILKSNKINNERLFILICISFVVYIIGYLIIFFVKGPVPMFSPHPAAARTDYSMFGIGLFPFNVVFITYFSIVYNVCTDGHSVKKRILSFLTFIAIGAYFLLLQRFHLIMAAIMVLVFLYYSTKHVRLRTLAAFVSIAIVIIYSINAARSNASGHLILYKYSLMRYPYYYAYITEPYMYVVMGLENFVRSVSMLDHYAFGFYTFEFIFSLTGLKHWIADYYGLISTPFLVSGYNTYTIFWSFYRDFGVIGMSLIPLLCGFLVGSLYHAMKRNPTINLVSMYCLSVFVMVFSFFTNSMAALWFFYISICMLIILKLIHISKRDLTFNT
jgi:oligosaccharide repeat unit polymerase